MFQIFDHKLCVKYNDHNIFAKLTKKNPKISIILSSTAFFLSSVREGLRDENKTKRRMNIPSKI